MAFEIIDQSINSSHGQVSVTLRRLRADGRSDTINLVLDLKMHDDETSGQFSVRLKRMIKTVLRDAAEGF